VNAGPWPRVASTAEDLPAPTVISLDWDYAYSSVLTDRSPGVSEVRCLDPRALGLSHGLTARLEAWLDRIERHSASWVRDDPVTDESRAAEEQFERDLVGLAYDVAHELGPEVEVLVRGEDIDVVRRRLRSRGPGT
jgi:hypothetical protein